MDKTCSFDAMLRRFIGLAATSWVLLASNAQGQDKVTDPSSFGKFNLPTITLGGTQLWTDHVHFRDWRIQQNVLTSHFRLIDPRNIRRAWGSLEQCENRLQARKQELGLAPLSGRIVILLHGLGRTRNSMNEMVDVLRKAGDCEIVNLSYASTRASLDDHAQALRSVIEHFPAECEIDIVAHSLGNLVLRRYLFNTAGADQQPTDSRIRRVVMLGPPNNGAEFARRLKQTKVFGVVLGRSASQLAELKSSPEALELAIPQCEFGIIAGNGRMGPIGNPLLDGENDVFVEVEETKLAGASDFIVLPVAHSFLLTDPTVHAATLRFLQHGYFVSEATRQPIPPESSPNEERSSVGDQ
jgi:hypothetical protein